MVINLKSVKIQSINGFADPLKDEIISSLSVLYTTPEGAVPFDRGFGINADFLDQPLPIARGRLIVEYTQKTRRFEPRANVKEVNFDTDPINGILIPKVVIEIVNELE